MKTEISKPTRLFVVALIFLLCLNSNLGLKMVIHTTYCDCCKKVFNPGREDTGGLEFDCLLHNAKTGSDGKPALTEIKINDICHNCSIELVNTIEKFLTNKAEFR